MDAFDVSLEGTCQETFTRRVMAPPVGVRMGGQPRFSREEVVERLHDIFGHPHELVIHGDGGVRYATRWPTVFAVLRRLDRSAVGVLWMRYSGESGSLPVSYAMTLANEKVRWRRSSRGGWGPKKTPS